MAAISRTLIIVSSFFIVNPSLNCISEKPKQPVTIIECYPTGFSAKQKGKAIRRKELAYPGDY